MTDSNTNPSEGVDASSIDADGQTESTGTDSSPDDSDETSFSAWAQDTYADVRADASGETVGRWLAAPFLWVLAQLGALVYGLARAFGKVLGGESFWRNIIKAGYKGLLKSSGGDAIMHIMHKGQMMHEPVAWDKDEQHYRTHGKEEWWNAPDESSHLYTAYNAVPTMWASSSANHVGDHVQAEVAEAMEFGDDRPVYQDADVELVLDATAASDAPGGGADAVADGGQQSMGVTHATVRDPGVLEDFVVPLGDPGEGPRGGRIVSGTKYHQTYPETVATEEMNRQEWRGREAERDMDQMLDQMKKIVLYALGFCALVVLAFTIGPQLVGSGGGGSGGSMIPQLAMRLPAEVL